ncbi:MAG TPA: thiamine pyrophosphate-dependent enzyme [Thermodesulfobacteriota bacterium]|nr:thiamine pyrophosphate-dependent enzyme [Thermodesulfobacteriota bacterium]
MSVLSKDSPGKKTLFMGNEAIARGAIEAGVRVCAAYPGNPSSEIIGSLSQVAEELGLYVEWSVNEKVALEVATAASFAGLRGLTAMKQNGLNVASDFLFNLNLSGTKGGLVVVVCDDPSALSSTNEEDSRLYAKMCDLPLLEPATVQEANEMTRWAFGLSEEMGVPCLIRSVTRLSHARGNAELGRLPKNLPIPHFDTSRPIVPQPVMVTHKALHDKMKKCQDRFEESAFNLYRGPEKPELLVVTCGPGWMYVLEALANLGVEDRAGIVKLGTTWPLPKSFLAQHLKKANRVLFVEEVDPFLENNIKEFCAERAAELGAKTFLGKASEDLPNVGEINPDIVTRAIQKVLRVSYEPRSSQYAQEAAEAASLFAPARELGFCAGCPHRATYWSLKNALAMDGRDGIVLGDIGCYTLGVRPAGFEQVKTCHAMGSGAGLANGFGQFERFGLDQPVLTVCGDSTFYHAAIPALVNARYNRSNFLMLILDNSATAMTGFQPHPGTGRTAMGPEAPVVDIEALCKSLGTKLQVKNPFDVQDTMDAIYQLLQDREGVKVLILRQECALVRAKRQKALYKILVDQERCIGQACGCNRRCTRIFKCPGLAWDPATGKARIDEAICTGCGVCADICPQSAILKETV